MHDKRRAGGRNRLSLHDSAPGGDRVSVGSAVVIACDRRIPRLPPVTGTSDGEPDGATRSTKKDVRAEHPAS